MNTQDTAQPTPATAPRLRNNCGKWFAIGCAGLVFFLIVIGFGNYFACQYFYKWGNQVGATDAVEQTIAITWVDHSGGSLKCQYGVRVYCEDADAEVVVKVNVHIGRNGGYTWDVGEIGRAKNFQEAFEKWGQISWDQNSVFLGDPNGDGYMLARKDMERHR